jgi:hypothetical protein
MIRGMVSVDDEIKPVQKSQDAIGDFNIPATGGCYQADGLEFPFCGGNKFNRARNQFDLRCDLYIPAPLEITQFPCGIFAPGEYRGDMFKERAVRTSFEGAYDTLVEMDAKMVQGFSLSPCMQASLRGSRYGWGLFAAGPSRLHIANGGFELPGSRSLPAGWETSWSNCGDTGVWVYDAGGKSSFLGDHVLRLHVGSGGGARFVLSDPRDVLPDTDYVVTVPVRFYFQSQDENAFVSLIQYDRDGHGIALDEIRLTRGQSLWTWESQILSIHTRPDTASVRMRLGLSAPIEAYLDVDGIQ